jgi:hypothetical protein
MKTIISVTKTHLFGVLFFTFSIRVLARTFRDVSGYIDPAGYHTGPGNHFNGYVSLPCSSAAKEGALPLFDPVVFVAKAHFRST